MLDILLKQKRLHRDYNLGMKKIFWAIQSLDNAGGSEAVSVNLMNLLCPYYDVTLVSTCSYTGEGVHKLDKRIKVVTLGIDERVGRFDQYWREYGPKHPFKRLALLQRLINSFVYRRLHYRRLIKKMMGEDDIFIASSLDSYLYAPKGRKCYFHYHFNRQKFLSFGEGMGLKLCRKPDKWIFLAKTTEDEIRAGKKKLPLSTYVYNPIKFPLALNENENGNAIMFIGRYTEQKDPMLALATAKILHDEGFPFRLDMYGDGHLEEAMRQYVKDNGLTEVNIHTKTAINAEHFKAHDLVLMTSAYEGYVLVKGEANVNSLPVISSAWEGPYEEMFFNQGDGEIVPSRDPKEYAEALKRWLSSKEAIIAQKKACYEFAKRTYSMEAIVNKWREILG